MQPGQHRGLGAVQLVGGRQPVGTTTQTAVHHLDLARGGGGGSGHWSGHVTTVTPQLELRNTHCAPVRWTDLGTGLPVASKTWLPELATYFEGQTQFGKHPLAVQVAERRIVFSWRRRHAGRPASVPKPP